MFRRKKSAKLSNQIPEQPVTRPPVPEPPADSAPEQNYTSESFVAAFNDLALNIEAFDKKLLLISIYRWREEDKEVAVARYESLLKTKAEIAAAQEQLQSEANWFTYNKEGRSARLLKAKKALEDLARLYLGWQRNVEAGYERYVKSLRLATANFTLHKSRRELVALSEAMARFMERFPSLTYAGDYIYYNSGEVLMDAINAYVEAVARSRHPEKERFGQAFFTESSVILAFTVTEWMALATKFMFLNRQIKDIDLVHDPAIQKALARFEVSCLLIMLTQEQIGD